MTIKEIKEKIISDANLKADEIIFQAKSKAEEMIAKAKKDAEDMKNDILAKNKQEGLLRKNKILTEANLDAKKTILSQKQVLIDSVFKKALSSILNMNDKDYGHFIKKLIMRNIENGDEIISICETDSKRITKNFLDRINQELKDKGKKGDLHLDSQYVPIKGGIIIGSGHIKKNISLELLMQKAREAYEMEISQQLFN